MTAVHTVSHVLDASQQAKAGATAFCTNFFPAQGKLQACIEHKELFGEARAQSAFFFRKDRDFFHFFFSAASASVLQQELAALPELKSERLVTDVVGNEAALGDLIALLESGGFRRYRRLARLTRPAQPAQPQIAGAEPSLPEDTLKGGHPTPDTLKGGHPIPDTLKGGHPTSDTLKGGHRADPAVRCPPFSMSGVSSTVPIDAGAHANPNSLGSQVVWAELADSQAILDLLDRSFDHFADQIPLPYEIDAAIESRQVLAIKCEGALAALLFFETQGFTSTVRYWVVAPEFQSRGFGSALIRHYFTAQNAVRRFILWVTVDNENAVQKYRHYGYAPDGLVDHVLINSRIPA